MNELVPNDYAKLLGDIKQRIRSAQYEALKAVNRELIALYWDIGRLIVKRQQGESWGKSVVELLAIVEYALRESNKPIGVAAYRIVSTLPAELQNQLPAPEQIAQLMEGI